jgi:AraC family transcriptional regulator, transcriptional activator FtrA
MKNVAILIYDHAAFFELGCAIELFALPRPEFSAWYTCDVVSFSSGPFAMAAGVQLQVKTVSNLDNYTMLVIPSWPTETTEIPEQIATAIINFHDRGARIISFCSGAFLLAQLGLLKGRKATTHWRYAEKFKTRFPETRYVDDVLYVYDGTLGCSAGSAAAIDLGIEVIRDDYGYPIANQVARRLVMSAHRSGGQSQFVETPVLQIPNHFAQALDWALQNLTSVIDINSLASKANMSRRTFDRKFRSTFNLTPNAWLTWQRINRAKELLEQNHHGIDKIAGLSGFDNATTFRHHFRKVVGVSPTQYRVQFSAGSSSMTLSASLQQEIGGRKIAKGEDGRV